MTDSTCDLDQETVERHGIHVIPLHVVFKDRTYLDRVEISPEEIYKGLDTQVPTTSTPSPQEAQNALESLREKGFTDVLAIHISSGLSATSNTIRLAAAQVAGLRTTIIDSKSLSMGLGFVVVQAARWLKEGVDLATVIERTEGMVARGKAYFVVKTLEYLRRGGRIGGVAAAVAGALDLKPIISIDEEGKYFSYKRVRGRKQSIRELFDIAREGIQAGMNQLAVMHGDALEEGQALYEQVKELPGIKELVFGQIGPVLVVHTGPGLLAVALNKA
jgi:DegV family protein with EDD domain